MIEHRYVKAEIHLTIEIQTLRTPFFTRQNPDLIGDDNKTYGFSENSTVAIKPKPNALISSGYYISGTVSEHVTVNDSRKVIVSL